MSQSVSNAKISANVVTGTIFKYSCTCFSLFNSTTWIVDLWASEHTGFDVSSFSSMTML